ncbi:hypothetical protein FG2_0522 [Lactococcus cremoris]|nr:hypothetical protein AB995_1383 [Lactococcus cremoris]KZK38422.1 hypothetical protein LMG6897_1694 [Lactococcus cremoris]KZK49765.1 hypothetical protein FG2_0522 [Lactococcus cremoris]
MILDLSLLLRAKLTVSNLKDDFLQVKHKPELLVNFIGK